MCRPLQINQHQVYVYRSMTANAIIGSTNPLAWLRMLQCRHSVCLVYQTLIELRRKVFLQLSQMSRTSLCMHRFFLRPLLKSRVVFVLSSLVEMFRESVPIFQVALWSLPSNCLNAMLVFEPFLVPCSGVNETRAGIDRS